MGAAGSVTSTKDVPSERPTTAVLRPVPGSTHPQTSFTMAPREGTQLLQPEAGPPGPSVHRRRNVGAPLGALGPTPRSRGVVALHLPFKELRPWLQRSPGPPGIPQANNPPRRDRPPGEAPPRPSSSSGGPTARPNTGMKSVPGLDQVRRRPTMSPRPAWGNWRATSERPPGGLRALGGTHPEGAPPPASATEVPKPPSPPGGGVNCVPVGKAPWPTLLKTVTAPRPTGTPGGVHHRLRCSPVRGQAALLL